MVPLSPTAIAGLGLLAFADDTLLRLAELAGAGKPFVYCCQVWGVHGDFECWSAWRELCLAQAHCGVALYCSVAVFLGLRHEKDTSPNLGVDTRTVV